MKKNTRQSRPLLRVAALTASAVITGCGGSGGGTQPLPGNPKGSHFDENASNEVLLSGTLTLDLPAPPVDGKVVFVSIRGDSGPPLAAKKLPLGPFPMDFEIRRSDLIPMAAERPIPDLLSVKASVDGDGDPMTAEDLPKWEGSKAKGATDVEIQMTRILPLPGNPKGSMYDGNMEPPTAKPVTDE